MATYKDVQVQFTRLYTIRISMHCQSSFQPSSVVLIPRDELPLCLG